MRKRFSIRLLLVGAATFDILNASASSKQPLSAAARASARIPGGQPRETVASAQHTGNPSLTEGKGWGPSTEALHRGSVMEAPGTIIPRKMTFLSGWVKGIGFRWTSGKLVTRNMTTPAGKLRSCPPRNGATAALPRMLSPQFHKYGDKIKRSNAERAELMARSRR